MPKIPRFEEKQTVNLPAPTMGGMAPAIGLTREAGRLFAAGIGEAGEAVWKYVERERKATRAVKAMQMEHGLRNDIDQLAESYYDRIDYDNFEADAEKNLAGLEQKYMPMAAGDRDLSIAFGRHFMEQADSVMKLVRDKKRQVITETGLGEFASEYDRLMEEYANEPVPEAREAKKAELTSKANALVASHIMTPVAANAVVDKFNATADMGRARKDIIRDPDMALEMLEDAAKWYPDLDSIQTSQLIEHAQVQIRLGNTRADRAIHALQTENQALALDDYARGVMDLDRLMAYRERDLVTGAPGLGDAFFAGMLEKIKSGRDIVTDPDLFNTLYLKPNLKKSDVDAYAGQISVQDQRILMGRILNERREDERDARRIAADVKAMVKAEASAAEKERKAEETAARAKRNAWAAMARTLARKAANEMGMKADEMKGVLTTLQGYIDDKDVEPEELPDKIMEFMETKKGIFWKWVKSVLFPDTHKAEPQDLGELEALKEAGGIVEEPVGPAIRPKRKSLDDIFGGGPRK